MRSLVFLEGDTVIHDNWDVAFSGTTIIVNGGEDIALTSQKEQAMQQFILLQVVMSDIKIVDTNKLEQDNASGPAIN